MPPSKFLTGPASSERLVCAPGPMPLIVLRTARPGEPASGISPGKNYTGSEAMKHAHITYRTAHGRDPELGDRPLAGILSFPPHVRMEGESTGRDVLPGPADQCLALAA